MQQNGAEQQDWNNASNAGGGGAHPCHGIRFIGCLYWRRQRTVHALKAEGAAQTAK